MTKEIDANNLKVIKDQMEAEAILTKKYRNMETQFQDSEIKQLCCNASDLHKGNLKSLKTYLDSHN
ncbi:MAG: hypothetical protein FWC47_07360 [Oscillospiraceae bacterium]|nr:hypothetical protein [Oscillospiraceae bacterium]